MNNFIFDELLAEEYREDRISEARRHNLKAQFMNKSISLSMYKSLANLGKRIEKLGAKIETHYNYLVVSEKRNIFANTAK